VPFITTVEPEFSTILCERDLHPHAPGERAELFHALNGGSAELEVLEFLYALVFLFKPSHLLETGTGNGFGTLALVKAVARNGFGTIHTVDIDSRCLSNTRDLLERAFPEKIDSVHLHEKRSLDFIEEWTGPPFDFVFFDSLISFRHLEFRAMKEKGLLARGAVCVFHDTSRLRGDTMHDYNPEMIQALDDESKGKQWLESGLSRGVRVLRLDE